jgi:SAM-dependent methyltransferase
MSTGIESYIRNTCRLCSGGLSKVFELTHTPLANSFPSYPAAEQERLPLELMKCDICSHVQLHHVPLNIYSNYKYQTPVAMKPRLQERARQLRSKYPFAKNVCEIGANNGLFTRALRDQGFMTVGVDPTAQDESLWQGNFDCEMAWRIKKRFGGFQLILANNVFAHIDNFDEVIAACDLLLEPDGHIVFEVQYLPDMLNSGMFDMIYHEHHDYHHLAPLMQFFESCHMTLIEYQYITDHGGSIRVTVQKTKTRKADLPVELLNFTRFADGVKAVKLRVQDALKGRTVAFGATAKACTLINHLDIADRIDYCVDETPQKIGRFIPGTNIKIYHPENLENAKPDTLFLTAWNYKQIIKKQYPQYNIVSPF